MMLEFGNIIALSALGLGIYNFYRSNFLVEDSLFLVRIDEPTETSHPHFGIVNNGNRDILITKIQCWLHDTESDHSIHPTQTIEIGANNIHILEKGKLQSCKVNFLQTLNKELFKDAKKLQENNTTIYRYNVNLHIS